ncbi:unnamed protein product [Amoebophrya sp. A120]|nr:unnamed protein product [Amoebophrya sp. A120]|eukprot:GSA120T00001664001.1
MNFFRRKSASQGAAEDLGGFDPNSPTHKKTTSGARTGAAEDRGSPSPSASASAPTEPASQIEPPRAPTATNAASNKENEKPPALTRKSQRTNAENFTLIDSSSNSSSDELKIVKGASSTTSDSSSCVENVSMTSVIADPRMQELPAYKLSSPTVLRNLLEESVSTASSKHFDFPIGAASSTRSSPEKRGRISQSSEIGGGAFDLAQASPSQHGMQFVQHPGAAGSGSATTTGPGGPASSAAGSGPFGTTPSSTGHQAGEQHHQQMHYDYGTSNNRSRSVISATTEQFSMQDQDMPMEGSETEQMDMENDHESMFEEWRFELASQLSSQPQLLQKMMQFMDHVQNENRDLRKERSQQMNKVNEVLRDASDTLCSQVNAFLAEKEQERQAQFEELKRKAGIEVGGENGSADTGRAGTILGAAAGEHQSTRGPKNTSMKKRFFNWIVKLPLLLFCVLFTVLHFLLEYATYVGIAREQSFSAGSDSFLLDTLGLTSASDALASTLCDGSTERATLITKNWRAANSFTSFVASRACQFYRLHDGSCLVKDSKKNAFVCSKPVPKIHEMELAPELPPQKQEQIVTTTLEALTQGTTKAESCEPAVQRCADELLSYKHEYHSMMKEYNRAIGEYKKSETSLNMLRMFVTRRGPVLEDPMGCWAQTFTPEICCSPWYGPTGHPGCWDGVVTYEKCCTLYRTQDTTSRHGSIAENALPPR